MNSRERFIAAMEGREYDFPPLARAVKKWESQLKMHTVRKD
ncbi:MAG TPA: hypothetical protein PKN36_03295 [bacterium]|nr:hypothetical protein [bacterium]